MASLTHFVVLDFEATCDGPTPPEPQEIIEFPSVLVDAETFETIDEFEAFVRPVHHPTLSPFCMELTGITQAEVDGAPSFPEVLEAHLRWLESHGLSTTEEELPYALLTCGDWDLQTALPAQLAACSPPIDYVPTPYRRWVNIKRAFKKWDRKKRYGSGMAAMLEALDIELVGRHHRGIDDSRNIMKLAHALALRGQKIEVTRTLAPSRYPTLSLHLVRGNAEADVVLNKRAIASLLGVASGAFRRGVAQVWEGERELKSDEDLRALRDGATLRVE